MYKEITIEQKAFPVCYYWKGETMTVFFGCIVAFQSQFKNNATHSLSIKKPANIVSDEDLKEVLLFINNMGAKIELKETDTEYRFVFTTANYVSWAHFLFYYTVLRYIVYNFDYKAMYCPNTMQKAMQMHNDYGEVLSEFNCFLLANVIAHKQCQIDDLHKVANTGFVDMPSFLEKVKTQRFNIALLTEPFKDEFINTFIASSKEDNLKLLKNVIS